MRFGFLELGIILLIVVLLVGAKKLPELAKSAGKSINIFKKEIKNPDDKDEEEAAKEE